MISFRITSLVMSAILLSLQTLLRSQRSAMEFNNFFSCCFGKLGDERGMDGWLLMNGKDQLATATRVYDCWARKGDYEPWLTTTTTNEVQRL